MNWKEHAANSSNSLLYRFNYFKQSTNFKWRKHLIDLHFTLVDYCSVIYDDISKEFDLKRNVSLILVIVISLILEGLSTSPSLYKRFLDWLTRNDQRVYFSVSLLFDTLGTGIPPYFQWKYEWNVPRRLVRREVKPLIRPSSHSSLLDDWFHCILIIPFYYIVAYNYLTWILLIFSLLF